MKETASSFWPRGLPAGALLAAFLIIPSFFVMMIDASGGTARPSPDAAGRFGMFTRPLQLRASDDFFAGRLAVQAMLSQRFTPAASSEPASAAGEGPNAFSPSERPEMARPGLLRLRLENHSDQNLEVEIVRVDSALGDFVARPHRLMLAPNQAASIDSPVAGQKITANIVPVAVALRLAGRVETRHLVLHDRTLAQAGN